jgi:polyisoprenoid-binding protein YceI
MKFNTVFLLSFFLLFTYSCFGQNESVSFKISKALTSIQGNFEKINYKVSLNEDGTGSIFGTADIVSINTKNKKRDEHLQQEDWFFVEKYPKIEIVSQKITKISDGHYKGTFEIKIKGRTQTKEIEFTTKNLGEKRMLTANFSLFIDDFDIGDGFLSYLVANEVQIRLQLIF